MLQDNFSALMFAALRGHVDAIRTLLAGGADINAITHVRFWDEFNRLACEYSTTSLSEWLHRFAYRSSHRSSPRRENSSIGPEGTVWKSG